MDLLQIVTPILIPYDSEPLTDKDQKTLIGIFVVLNIVWILSLLISALRILIRKQSLIKNFIEQRDKFDFTSISDFFMIMCWAAFLIVYFGILISNQF